MTQSLNDSITRSRTSHLARHPESIIGILKLRRNTRPRRAPRHFDVMAPRSAARSLARRPRRTPLRTLLRPPRIALSRDGIVIRVVPVAAPFVNVIAHVVKSERVRSINSNRLRPSLPSRGVVGERLRQFVSPREVFSFNPAPRRVLPLGFGGQSIEASGLRT